MNNNLPKKYEESFWYRIKRFFSNIFSRNKINESKSEMVVKTKTIAQNNIDEFAKMKAESRKVKLKEEIIEMIDKNPKLIDTLSATKLKELNNMYDKIIEENERIIKGLQRKIAQSGVDL